MTAEVVGVLGIAATLAVAAIAAMFTLIKLMIKFSAEQTEYRHKLRDELTTIVLNSEHRLERRIERLEFVSVGFRNARRQQEQDGNGNGH